MRRHAFVRAGASSVSARPGHVLILVQNLPVPLDRRVWLQARALTRAGHEVSVVCPKGPGDPAYQVLEGVHLYKFTPPRPVGSVVGYAWEFGYCFVRIAALARRADARRRVDVVQACNPPDTFAPLGRYFQRRGAKFVYDQHDLCPELYSSRFDAPRPAVLSMLTALERSTYRAADHVISTNESYRRTAIERGTLAPDRVTVVRNGPDTRVMTRGEPEPDLRRGKRFLLVYLGVMGPQDGVDGFLRVLHTLRTTHGRDDVAAALLGFGDCLGQLKAQATRLGLDDIVEFTGRAGPDTIARYLSTADIGISPDQLSAFTDVSTMNKTMEYMSYGLPTVAYDLRETRVSTGPDAAVLVPTRDEAAFAAAVDGLLYSPLRRERMGAAARARAVTSLDWRLQERIYLSLYQRLLSGTGPTEPIVLEPRRPSADAPAQLALR